jgi:DNA ligase (NAD+)
VGEKLIARLWELGLVRSLPDLYRLTKEQLVELDGFGETSATNVINAIAASRSLPLGRVLFGLNIPDVGWVTAQSLARHFGTIERLAAAPQEEIMACEGIGPERAEAIAEWFADEANRALVAELWPLLDVREEEPAPEGPLTGRQYVITGTLESLTREQAQEALEALGAKVSDSVSKKTTGLIVGESPGASKLAKADAAGVPRLDEDALAELLAQPAARA